MKQQILYFLFIAALLTSCGNGEAGEASVTEDATTSGEAGAFFPVVSYLKGQVAHVDSSLYTLVQINKSGNAADTVYIRREDFKNVSAPFTTLPDITTGKLKKKYNESRLYDETLDRFIITYTPKKADEELEVLRQDVVITPNTGDGDQVESVYIERLLTAGDSTVQLKMNWEVSKGFTIHSIIQKEAAPEKLQTTEVIWAGPRSAAKL